MRDADCVQFLQWCLPRLGLRWAGYRKVRRTVCKRVGRRLAELGLADTDAYRDYLLKRPDEWVKLDGFCRIPISRFWRDRAVFAALARTVLPELAARGNREIRCWSAGAASGEEPYSLSIAWAETAGPAHPDLRLAVLATDVEPVMLARAEAGRYGPGSFRDLPAEWLERAFHRDGADFVLRTELRCGVTFQRQDIRTEMPDGPFDLILCRNLAFTYFDRALQQRIAAGIDARLRPGGYLVIGGHERLPPGGADYTAVADHLPIFRKPAEADRRPTRI